MKSVYAYAAAGSLALIVGAYTVGNLRGYSSGVAHERARHEAARLKTQDTLFQLGEQISRQAADLAEIRRERESLVLSLENAALDAPGADRAGIGPDGLRRLERRWGAP